MHSTLNHEGMEELEEARSQISSFDTTTCSYCGTELYEELDHHFCPDCELRRYD